MTRLSYLLFAAAIVAFSYPVLAQADPAPIKAKFLIEGGIEFGGDDFFDAFPNSVEAQEKKAGQGGSFGAGGQLEFTDVPYLMFRSVLSYKFLTTTGDDTEIRFTRLPFHVSAFYKINDFRVGVGAATHFNPKLNGGEIFSDQTFDSSWAPRFEVGFKWIGVTYTPLTYTTDDGQDISGNSLGVFLSFGFPN